MCVVLHIARFHEKCGEEVHVQMWFVEVSAKGRLMPLPFFSPNEMLEIKYSEEDSAM